MQFKIKIGDRVYLRTIEDGEFNFEPFILAQVDAFRVSLISLISGNRWNNPALVDNPDAISYDEWQEIAEVDEYISGKYVWTMDEFDIL